LIIGGVLAAINWRLVFLVSVPVGIAGTIWAYTMLREVATIREHQRIDWLGNVTFALGLTIFLLGITYGIEPYGGSPMGWGNPLVIRAIFLGIVLLVAFVWIELHVDDPMFRLELFKIRMFTAGNTAAFLSALGRGGLQFMLIIWLQGIWLPLHGYSFEETPLWAGILMTPLLLGFILMGPLSGYLSDRFGARLFSTTGMLLQVIGFLGLTLLPANFNYLFFAVLQAISPTHRAILLGKAFFPNLIATPFMESLHAVFYISAALYLIGATVSLLRDKHVVYGQAKN
jgi:MFS family permease